MPAATFELRVEIKNHRIEFEQFKLPIPGKVAKASLNSQSSQDFQDNLLCGCVTPVRDQLELVTHIV